jgi:hypothetical protein
MTLIQIAAIIQLLFAFGVPQPTIDTIQAILIPTAPQQALNAPVSPVTTGIGGIGTITTPAPNCTPVLEGSIQFEGGDLSTGMDYTFTGTSTYPVGCKIDTGTEVDLQTPTIKYRGTIGNWLGNQGALLTDNVFTYRQGWGPGQGQSPEFIWFVGDKVLYVPI